MEYYVAGIYFCINTKIVLDNTWNGFKKCISDDANIDITIDSCCTERIHGLSMTKFESKDCMLVMNDEDIMIVNQDSSHARLVKAECALSTSAFTLQLFYTHAVQRHMIQLHSSLIATIDNRGLMFLGPSGIGKITQAELWHRYRNAIIINGDCVFVQETVEAFLGWGTPWHGSSPYCENTNVPVEALIVLKQAPENSIRELTGFEKVSEVSNSVFYPRWLENGMELCLETLDHLLSKLPVYELRCRPDC